MKNMVTIPARVALLFVCLPFGACGSAEPIIGFDGELEAPPGPGQGYSLVRRTDGNHQTTHIAVSDDYVFFTSDWQGLYRVPKYGGAIEAVEADSHALVQGVATNGSDVFWTHATFGANDAPHIKLKRRSATGGPITVIKEGVFGTGGANYTSNLLADATNVYALDSTFIWALPLDGGQATQIAFSEDPLSPVHSGPDWVPDYPAIYVSTCFSATTCSLVKTDLPSGNSQNLLPLQGGLVGDSVEAVDESHIYLVKNQRVSSVSKSDLSTTDLFTPEPGQTVYWFLLVDATNVYFVSYGGTQAGWQLRAVPKAGGPAQVVGWGSQLDHGIWEIAQDDQFLFVLAGPTTNTFGPIGNEILAFPKSPTTN